MRFGVVPAVSVLVLLVSARHLLGVEDLADVLIGDQEPQRPDLEVAKLGLETVASFVTRVPRITRCVPAVLGRPGHPAETTERRDQLADRDLAVERDDLIEVRVVAPGIRASEHDPVAREVAGHATASVLVLVARVAVERGALEPVGVPEVESDSLRARTVRVILHPSLVEHAEERFVEPEPVLPREEVRLNTAPPEPDVSLLEVEEGSLLVRVRLLRILPVVGLRDELQERVDIRPRAGLQPELGVEPRVVESPARVSTSAAPDLRHQIGVPLQRRDSRRRRSQSQEQDGRKEHCGSGRPESPLSCQGLLLVSVTPS